MLQEVPEAACHRGIWQLAKEVAILDLLSACPVDSPHEEELILHRAHSGHKCLSPLLLNARLMLPELAMSEQETWPVMLERGDHARNHLLIIVSKFLL